MSEFHDTENSGADNRPQSSSDQEEMLHVDSREDLFVDAPDELNDNKEGGTPNPKSANASPSAIHLEEKQKEVANQFKKMHNNDSNRFVNEIERLQASLEQAVDEKEKLEEEMEVLAREVHIKDKEIEGLNATVTSFVAEAEEVYAEKHWKCEGVMERILAALGSVVDQGDISGDSGGDQIDLVEKSTLALMEKYNQFLIEVNQLGQCLTKAEHDFGVQEFGTVFVAARDEVFELRRKEAELIEKIGLLEDENRKLLEQVENEKSTVETLNSELENMKTEVEQEKTKCANAKEKLNLAVTKGKALVHQRDVLKQSMADKTNELDNCLAELREKTNALEAADLHKEELVKSENLVASLQESLSQKTLILETFEHILSHLDVPEELQSVDIVGRVRWLANERNELKGVSLDFYRLKDTICAIDLPENISFPDLDSRLAWLKESFYRAKDEINMLQNELCTTKEVASDEIDKLSALILTVQQEKDCIKEEFDQLRIKNDEIVARAEHVALDKDHLSDSLAAELTEKDKIQKELDDLTNKYENVVEKVHQLSSEKDQMIRLLVEGSRKVMVDQDGIEETYSNLPMLIDRFLEKIQEQTSPSVEIPFVDTEPLDKYQFLLYVRDLESMLYKELLEEDMLVRSQLNDLSNLFKVTSQELFALKEDKDVLQKDLERSEEKSGLLREKLTMAVKKGKLLVQERENLKVLLEEKKSEIQKLRLELQQEESRVAECTGQMSTLSADLERVPKMESSLASMKEENDQLENLLFESNSKLQRVVESIDRIVIPVDTAFLEPIEKLNLLVGYIDDCQTAKTETELELGEVKEETSTLAVKLAEAQETIDSLTNKFAEACEARKSLEEALSLAENKNSILISEKEEVQGSKAASEMEVEKAREEVTCQTSRLTEAYNTIKSLENALSLSEMTVNSLTEQSNKAHAEITNLNNELKKLKYEIESQTNQLTDAGKAIKSLEDALVRAENDFSALLDEKITADQEVSTLNSKLNVCMEELARSSGSLASRSTELIGHLNNLQMLAKDQSLLSTMNQCFDRNLARLKDLDLTIKNTREHLFDNDLELLQGYPLIEDIASLLRQFSDDTDNTLNIEMEKVEANAINADDVSSCFRRITEVFQFRNKLLADRFEGFSSFLDESLAALLRKLQATEDEVKSMTKNKQEYDQKELDNLTSKYEKVVEKVQQLSSEKDQMIQLLVEGSGIVMGGQEGIEETSSNLPMLIDRCLKKIKEQTSASLEIPFVDPELFENFQSLLYVRDLKLMLFEEILEEDMLLRSTLNDLSNQFQVTSQELFALKEEKDVLQKDLEQSEEKSGLLREKLSMAVKKGKGLVQDRDKLKVLLEEKKSEIEKLRLELQQEESRVAEFTGQISTLSADLERIPKLERNLASMKEEKDQLEKFFFESNGKLQRVIESIDRIFLPVDSALLEPVEKLNLLAGYIDDCQTSKIRIEQELREVKEEASTLAGKLAEAQATIDYCQTSKTQTEQELQKVKEEASILVGKLAEAQATIDCCQTTKIQIEQELREVKEEASIWAGKLAKASILAGKLTEAQATMKLLEESLAIAKDDLSQLAEEKKEMEIGKNNTEIELQKAIKERDVSQCRVLKLESDVGVLEDSCREARVTIEEYQAKEDGWKEKEEELLSSYNSLLMKEKEAEEPLLSAYQTRILLKKLVGIEIPLVESDSLEPRCSADVKKLFSVIGSFTDLQNQLYLLSSEKEELQCTFSRQNFEIEHLKEEIETHVTNKTDLEQMKTELFEVTFGLEKIIVILGGKEFIEGQNPVGTKTLLLVLEKQVNSLLLEAENSKSKAEELGTKLALSQQVMNELSTKVKLLEDYIQGKTILPENVQERGIFEAPSASTGSEISEIEDPVSYGKNTMPPAPLAPHVRSMRKGSTDHLALNIEPESVRLINSEETDEQKGHLFKSLNTSGLVPKQGKLIADRVDGLWVSSGQVLSSRPRARLGLITYCLLLHIWLLGTIL
ncbi:GRIP and coiled-coil domain-containing protein 2-like isoform X2 [Hibiscus syriacus]|uniref:GRIP and coiled-coil domain-containing protein 2-like isoform X2 n=1 Tax=Hibiscus syriacus TaxID=106335 RepID=UPI00192395F2|nr:GRIP and coiled-coil domain-containing protein 2-like isoform X2 [Hibiscus syriacus]